MDDNQLRDLMIELTEIRYAIEELIRLMRENNDQNVQTLRSIKRA